MNIDQRIREARSALQELTADEVELTRLEAEQTGQIQALKASGSRDFAALAELEGKRNALASMIAEQRQAISQAQAELTELEGQKVRGESLADLQVRVDNLIKRRREVESLLTDLSETLRDHLQRIAAARVAWAGELETAQQKAVQAFSLRDPRFIRSGRGSAYQEIAEWDELFSALGENSRAALLTQPTGKYAEGMNINWVGLNTGDPYDVDKARRSVVSYLDRPVSLLIADVLNDVNSRLPHCLKGGEQ